MSQSYEQKDTQRMNSAIAFQGASNNTASQVSQRTPPSLQLKASELEKGNSEDTVIQGNFLGDIRDSLQDTVEWGGDMVRSGSEYVGDQIESVGDTVSEGIGTMGEYASSGIAGAGEMLNAGAESVGNLVSSTGEYMGNTISAGGDFVADKVREYGPDFVGDMIDQGAESAGNTVSGIGRSAGNATKSAGRKARNMSRTASKTIQKTTPAVQQIVDKAADKASEIVQVGGETLADVGERVYESQIGTLLETGSSIEAGITGTIEKAKDQGLAMAGGVLFMTLADAFLDFTEGDNDAWDGPEGKEMSSDEIDDQARKDELFAHDMAYWVDEDRTELEIPDKDKEKVEELNKMGYDTGKIVPVFGTGDFSMVYILPKPGSGKLPVIAFTGTNTEMKEHLETNTDWKQVGHNQYYENEAKINAVFEMFDGQVEIVGHSLGGALAQIAASEHTDQVAKLTTFQAPGVHHSTREQYETNLASRAEQGLEAPVVNHHVVRNDIVSLAGETNLPGNYYLHNKGDQDSYDAHTKSIFDGENHEVTYYDNVDHHPYANRRETAESIRSGIGFVKELWGMVPKAEFEPQDLGSKPTGNGLILPYLYQNRTQAESGVEIGKENGLSIGGYQGEYGSINFPQIHTHSGKTQNEDGGDLYSLIKGKASVLSGDLDIAKMMRDTHGEDSIPEGMVLNAEGSALSAGADAWFDPENGMYAGLSADWIGGSMNVGTSNSNSNRDQQLKFGAGAGVGAGGGVSWGDEDQDGYREIGGEFSIPGLPTFGYKTEDPLRDIVMPLVMSSGDFTSPIPAPMPFAVNQSKQILPEENLTHYTIDQIAELVNSAKGAIDGINLPFLQQATPPVVTKDLLKKGRKR